MHFENFTSLPFSFPDGPLRRDRVYHVEAVQTLRDGSQGVFLTGMRVLHGSQSISWHHSRFRKVDSLMGHVPKKRRRMSPVPPIRRKRSACIPTVTL